VLNHGYVDTGKTAHNADLPEQIKSKKRGDRNSVFFEEAEPPGNDATIHRCHGVAAKLNRGGPNP
jgi:hypothetical protein